MYVFQKPNGHWRAVVQVNGHRRSVTAPTKKATEALAAQLRIDMGGLVTPSDVTVSRLLAEWQDTGGVKGEFSPTFIADIDSLIPKLPASFTDLAIDRVDPATVSQLYRDLRRRTEHPLSVHRVRRVHTVLHAAFAAAVTEFHWLSINPIEQVRAPATPETSVHAPSVADVTRILNQVQGTQFGLYLELSAISGARRGEIVALQWADLDDDVLEIHRSLSETAKAGVQQRSGKTGAKGHRSIVLPREIVDALGAHRRHQNELAIAQEGSCRPVWIFSHDYGDVPWRPGYVSLKFRRLCADLDITGVRLHDLRHFMATQMLSAGVPLSVVSKRVGHNRTATTNRYTHHDHAADQVAAETMERILNRR